MKTNTYIEFSGKKFDNQSILSKAKELWTKDGNKLKDIQSIKLYMIPEKNEAHVVINEEFKDCFYLD